MSTDGILLTGFKECDIRGELGNEINEDLAYRLGRAIGTSAHDQKAVVGGDFRTSTPQLLEALKRGLVESGVHVYDLGQVTTPVYYFGRKHLGIKTGVMVTASHNPPAWNGFKPVLGDYPITPADLEQIKEIVNTQQFTSGQGTIEFVDIKATYVDWLAQRFAGITENLPKVIFDCGNGATGWIIDTVLEKLGIQAPVMFAEPDGKFPHRSPDISKPGDLAALQKAVLEQGAALGFGFDGDGDRVGVVDENGQHIPSDRLIAWLAQEILPDNPGDAIVYDLKLSRSVPETIERYGGKPIPQKSGHTFIKTAMLDNNAIMGGEYSGHLFYRELGGGDDGLFSALLVCAQIAKSKIKLGEALANLPVYYSTPDIRIKYTGSREEVIQHAIEHAQQSGAEVTLIDGVKAEYAEGWALMRASVTEPAFTLRFEGSTKDAMLAVAEKFLAGLDTIHDPVWKQITQYTQS